MRKQYSARVALVERDRSALSLQQQAALLSLSRSRLYYQLRPPSAEEIAIKHRLDELPRTAQYPFHGSRKMTALLLWRSVKHEDVYLHDYTPVLRLKCGLNTYLTNEFREIR